MDSLNCLRHDTVIGGYNEDCNIGNLSTSCTHCCECLMSGCVEAVSYTHLKKSIGSSKIVVEETKNEGEKPMLYLDDIKVEFES